MNDFFMKRLIVKGSGKEPSYLDFDNGLNIICGPSNTGKTYVLECIDYLFGNDKIHFDENTGYDSISLIIETKHGDITFERQLGTKKIYVSSNNPRIESGKYGTSGKNNISYVWLKLIGIDEEHTIIKSERYKRQRLTWRTFAHMFLIKESLVIKDSSILRPIQNTANTAALSALYFLITGEDFSNFDPLEEKKIKEAKKKAVVDYINKRLTIFANRKDELDKYSNSDALYLQAKVEQALSEIAETELKIAESIKTNKQLLNETYQINEQLSEVNTLYNRYQALKSQYSSDIKRMTFIVEGELNKKDTPRNSKCPFCDSDILFSSQKEKSYVEASHAELHRIQIQLDDLVEAENDLKKERSYLTARLGVLNEKRSGVEDLINSELKPKMQTLKSSLAEYRRIIEIRNEFEVIDDYQSSMKNELYEAIKEEETEMKFKIKSYFNREILENIDQYLDKILDSCQFDSYNSVYLDPRTFDLVINGKRKETFGKGYRAFLNTTLAIALMEYLSEQSKYSPNMLLIDSPILSLKEREDRQVSSSMKAHLFQYLLKNQKHGQVIIIENDIPELNYEDANIIQFTKDESHGRYGFLNDIH